MGQPSFTVYVDNVGTPHAFIKLDDGNGHINYYGFAPSTPGDAHGPGTVGESLTTHARGDVNNSKAGYIDDAGWSKTIAIDSSKFDAMMKAVDAWDKANHTYNGLATFGGENCTTFVQAVAKAGGITEIVTSRASLPINLIPTDERRGLFKTDADGQRSLIDAMKNPMNTPGTPASEFKKANPELFKAGPNPKTDATNSDLKQNKDGSFTEVIKLPNGDSQINAYAANGAVTGSTQTDGAKNDSDYASRTTVYDAQGRDDWRSTIYDDGTRGRIDFDQKSEREDKTVETLTDAQGRLDWERLIRDDGASHFKDHDQKGERGDRLWETFIDAQGRIDSERVTQDSGAIYVADYDQKGERADRLWETFIDAQGRIDSERVTRDFGAIYVADHDQKAERSDRLWETFIDAQGRIDQETVHNDDGSRTEINYDQDNTQPWDKLITTYTIFGRDTTDVVYDPGVTDPGTPPPLVPFPATAPDYVYMPPGTACVSALGGTSCEPRYDVDYGWF